MIVLFNGRLWAALSNHCGCPKGGHLSLGGVMSERYFLCARKSTDVEDKQVLSIEALLAELRAYGKQERLEIVDELVEKQLVSIMRPFALYWVRIPDPQPTLSTACKPVKSTLCGLFIVSMLS